MAVGPLSSSFLSLFLYFPPIPATVAILSRFATETSCSLAERGSTLLGRSARFGAVTQMKSIRCRI
jgi:hypothetical protein